MRKREPRKGEHLKGVDIRGADVLTEWRVCNPFWPSGSEPYMELCPGCPKCPDPANRTD